MNRSMETLTPDGRAWLGTADGWLAARESDSHLNTYSDGDIAAELVTVHELPLAHAEQIVAQAVELRARRAASLAAENSDEPAPAPSARKLHTVSLGDFAGTDEAGAEALLGDADNALIPEDSDCMVYGDGGAGKTTLTTDLAFHLAAGKEWLGIPVARAARVLLIENEGPRALFRKKLRGKVDAWVAPPLEDRLSVLEKPWGEFTFAEQGWRDALARRIAEEEIDVLIAGPVTRLGMDEAGTLQQVRDFMKLVADVRSKSFRRLVVVLVHHQNKAGTASGAWEGAGDTLIHVEARGHGGTALRIEKARWSSEHHGAKLDLAWAPGEGFTVKDERDYAAEIERLLGDGKLRTLDEIRASRESKSPGIGAGRKNVEDTLDQRGDKFRSHEGRDIGRSAKGKFYGLAGLAI
jgi:hypothetical protein